MTRATSLGSLAKPVGNLHRPPGVNLPLGRPAPNFGAGLACQDHRNHDPNIWFAPDRDLGLTLDDAAEAKRICRDHCPALHECLAWGVVHQEPHGIWGGLSELDRRRLKRGAA
jgi:WhiB family redox-sensing transcriptional regulator